MGAWISCFTANFATAEIRGRGYRVLHQTFQQQKYMYRGVVIVFYIKRCNSRDTWAWFSCFTSNVATAEIRGRGLRVLPQTLQRTEVHVWGRDFGVLHQTLQQQRFVYGGVFIVFYIKRCNSRGICGCGFV